MFFYILSIVIVVKIYFLSHYFSRRVKNRVCFSPDNFDKLLVYTQWKQATSKIGKVLVKGYRVEVSPENEILFKLEEDNYTVFKVSRVEGIVLLAVKHRASLTRKANNAFCELLDRALLHPILPDMP